MSRAVVVYGATGFTGRRVARELHRLRIPTVLAGRDRERLERLAAELGGAEIRLADASGCLDGLAEGAAVMVSTVGPFERFGEAAVREAIRAGAQFCDTTGEQGYMRRVLERYDRPARERGVAVLNAQAVEFAVGYCLGGVLLRRYPDTERLEVFQRVSGFSASRGTKKSALISASGDALVLRDGQLVDPGILRLPAAVDWPGEGRFAAVPFPGGEALHLPKLGRALRHVGTHVVLPVPAALALAAVFALRPLVRVLAKAGAIDRLERLLDRAPEGPSDSRARESRWATLVRARGPYGEALALAEGRDVYGTSGAIAARAAALLAEGRCRTPGVVCTAEAFDPSEFLDALAESGVRWRAEAAEG